MISNDQANAANAAEAGDGEVPPDLGTGPRLAVGPSALPPSPPRGADVNAQLAQARELEAKVAEEYRAVRLLRASITGEASARGERARELGRQARDRINADFNVDNPSTPPRASQKLIAATTLLRAMPTPSTPEAWNLHRETQELIEQAAVQQAESSASCMHQQGSARDDGGDKAPSPRCTQAAQRSVPPTRGARRPRSGSSTRAGNPKMATLATSSTPGGRATWRRGQRRATTLDGVGATTAERTTRRRRSPRGPVCSARKSARRASPSASANPRRLTNTTGRRTPVYGSTTNAWRVCWVGPPPTRFSSVTSPAPRRLSADVARAPAGQPDPQLG
jgi:hypothetical protein